MPTECYCHLPQIRCQTVLNFLLNICGDIAVERFGNPTRDAREGVTVASEGNGIAYRVLVGIGIQESDDGFRYRSLTGYVEGIDKFYPFPEEMQLDSTAGRHEGQPRADASSFFARAEIPFKSRLGDSVWQAKN